MNQALTNKVLKDIANGRMLSNDEELDCLRRVKETGCERSRDMLIEGNMRYVLKLALQFRGIGTLELPDLVNSGALGLVKAIETFDPARGNKFMTYAIWRAKQAIIEEVRENTSTVRLPANQRQLMIKALKVAREENIELTDDVRQLVATAKGCVSFDAPVNADSSDSSTYGDTLASDSDTFSAVETSDLTAEVKSGIASLKPREAKILQMYYGMLGYNYKLHEISDELGISVERVRQIKDIAMNRFRKQNVHLAEMF